MPEREEPGDDPPLAMLHLRSLELVAWRGGSRVPLGIILQPGRMALGIRLGLTFVEMWGGTMCFRVSYTRMLLAPKS